MTVSADAARQAAADAYKHAAINDAAAYRSRALAEQAAREHAEQTQAAAARKAAMPVIIGTAPSQAEPSAVVTIQRPQDPDGKQTTPAPSQAVTPLPQPVVDSFLAEHSRYDPAGVAALRAEWGGDLPSNLAYAGRWFSNHLTTEQRDRLVAEGFDVLPMIRLAAEFGRSEAHSDPATSTTTTGKTTMAEQMTKDAAQKRYGELTKKIHDARFRGDHMAVRELDAERTLLGEALYPGSSEPDANHRRTI